MKKPSAPLFRKTNTRARNVHHNFGGDYRWERAREKRDDRTYASMHGPQRRGLDYTPLFRFMLVKVGHNWDDVHREAVARLDHEAPIFWLVARRKEDGRELVRVGESSYYSGLFIDDDGRLRVVNPDLTPEDLTPACACCTHTFNGVRFPRTFRELFDSIVFRRRT